MQIILLKNVPGMGSRFDVKNVADGYAVNFLFPKKLAEAATPQSLKRMEILKKNIETEQKIRQDLLAKNMKALSEVRLVITEKVNDKGHLFAGVHQNEISVALKKQTELDVPPECIELDKPIKAVGEYEIPVSALGKSVKFKLVIEAK